MIIVRAFSTWIYMVRVHVLQVCQGSVSIGCSNISTNRDLEAVARYSGHGWCPDSMEFRGWHDGLLAGYMVQKWPFGLDGANEHVQTSFFGSKISWTRWLGCCRLKHWPSGHLIGFWRSISILKGKIKSCGPRRQWESSRLARHGTCVDKGEVAPD